MSLEFILFYIITVSIASIIPGPSMLLALTHGMQYGAKRTIATALGNVTITLIQASISIAGIGTILLASEPFFRIVKWVGAIYLIYIGLKTFFSKKLLITNNENSEDSKPVALSTMYIQGVLVTAGNPKAIVFFTAIFPQFIDPDKAFLYQSGILLGLCIVIAFVCFMIYAICGQKVVHLFSNARAGMYLKRIIGGSFIGAGIGLVFSNKC